MVKTELPTGCKLNQPLQNERLNASNAEEEKSQKRSIYRAVCSMDECTLGNSEVCASRDALCCCRSQTVEELDISCDDQITVVDPALKQTATSCSCAPCDDVIISVRVRVKGQGDDGPIPAAQLFDMEEESLIGLTLYNGILDFEVPYRKRKLQLLVQATGYQRVTRGISLSPKHAMVVLNVTMVRIMVANIGHGKSEIVYPLGKWAWLYAQPGTFRKHGTTHDHEVILKGSYVDASNREVLDMIDSNRFEVDGKKFALIAALFMEFEDLDGEPLDVSDLRLAVPVENQEEELAEMFALIHDWESGKWSKLSTFYPVQTKRGKRASISETIVEAPDITVAEFVVLAAEANIDCWVQIRTFNDAQDPFPGPLVSVLQRRGIGGLECVFVYGTNTRGAQTSDEFLASNAACIPLDCNDFIETLVFAYVEPSRGLTAVPFPPNTFTNDPSEPVVFEHSFSLAEFRPAEIARAPHPFYVFEDNCIEQGREPHALSDPRDYFSFATDYTPLEPDTDQCYVKLSISNCFFRTSTPTVVTFDPQTGAVTSSQTFPPQGPLAVPAFGSGTPEECLQYETTCPSVCSEANSVCLPFRCGERVRVTVRSTVVTTGEILTCLLNGVSPALSDSILAFRGETFEPFFEVDTSVLDPGNYNDRDLGLYFDPQPTTAREACNGGGQGELRGFINRLGNAAEFGCFTDNGP